jgi:hypothetical protein
MGAPARANLEALLRARKLDRTLVPADKPPDAAQPVSTGVADLDARLGGGLPRGELSEMAGARSSGRTTLAFGALRAVTAEGEVAAIVDAFDRFDPESAAAAGVELARVLWVRGETRSIEAAVDPAAALERAIKAFNLVLQAGGFAVAVLDVADVPIATLRRLPFTTWFRLARTIEGGRTAALVLTPEHLARSPGGATIALEASPRWAGTSDRSRRYDGLCLRASVPSLRVS